MPQSFQIVTVDVSVIEAPAPNLLQQTGAFVTQGGTQEAAGSLTQVATLEALLAILANDIPNSAITWTANVAHLTTTASLHWGVGDQIPVTVAGATPAAYNGTRTVTVTSSNAFHYALLSNPGGPASVPGTSILAAVSELEAMGTTYFAQNGVVAPYVLELGEGNVAAGITALGTWLTNNPFTVYGLLIPREWSAQAAMVTLANLYTAPNKELYFWITTVLGQVTGEPPLTPYAAIKSAIEIVEAPGLPASEFSLASIFAFALSRRPSSSQPLGPLSYAPVYGVTPYPLMGNQGTFLTLAEANVGWIGTGQQGGISGNIIFQGQMQDGNPWNFWYSTDWAQININLALANEVINGSVPSSNPLLYDQQGIDRLQNRAVSVLNQAVASGLAIGQVVQTSLPIATFNANLDAGVYDAQLVINAEPFQTYITENPSDYEAGIYGGLTCAYIPARGFLQIIFGLAVEFSGGI